MLNRVRVVTLLTTTLVLFSLLQISSSGIFFQTIRGDKQNFMFNQHIRDLQTSLGTSWMALVQARTLLNQVGMNRLNQAGKNQPQTELIDKINTKLQLAKNAMTEFNQNLRQDETGSVFTTELNKNHQLYYSTLVSLLSDINQNDIPSFMTKPTQRYQDDFEKAFKIG